MATCVWSGAVSGDWGVAGNWDTGVPVADDTVIFSSGSVNVDAGLDQSAIDLRYLYIGEGYTGQIGTSTSNPLKVSVSNTATVAQPKCVWGGGASTNFIDFGATGCDYLIIEQVGSGTDDLQVEGNVGVGVIVKGDIDIADDTWTTCYIAPENGTTTNVTLHIDDSTVTTLYCKGATITADDPAAIITTLHMYAGTCTVSAGTLTNCYLYGGTVNWETDDANMTLCTLLGGTLDCSGLLTPRTITTLNAFPQGIYVANAADNITITNKNLYFPGERMRV